MGLNHPVDLAEWHRWEKSQSPVRRIRERLWRTDETPLALSVRGEFPKILVVMESTKPTSVAAYMRPLRFLPDTDIAVLAPTDMSQTLPGGGWKTQRVMPGEAMPNSGREICVILAAGNYLPVGALAYRWATMLDAKFLIVQHGLLTPHAPPLPAGGHLLAFSPADADYWSSGRADVSSDVVGSQLLWEADKQKAPSPGGTDAPVFLGQLHGAELPRMGKARAAGGFCRRTGASYRPHPAESDILSRLQHMAWERQGVEIDRSTNPLKDLNRPVVSAFSTGVLEAAARGIPSWVSYDNPPSWLGEFWDRYGMALWGGDPTPAPVPPGVEPALAIARILEELIGGPS